MKALFTTKIMFIVLKMFLGAMLDLKIEETHFMFHLLKRDDAEVWGALTDFMDVFASL